MPIGWFYFFRITDVVLINVEDWQEVKLIAPKDRALTLFESRRVLFERYLTCRQLSDATAGLISNLVRWPGQYLLVDPSEVVDGDDLHHKTTFEQILTAIDGGESNLINDALGGYCKHLSDDPEIREFQVLGYTYRWD